MNINIHSPEITIEDLDLELTENPHRIEEVSFNGWTPLISACNYGNIEIAKWLLDNGADIHARDNYGGTCLHWACREGKEEMAAFLLDYGVDMESVNNVGATPLHVCCGGGGFMLPQSTLEARVNIAAMLVDRGANLEANKLNGMTPLQFMDSAAHKERLLEVAAKAQSRMQSNAIADAEAAALEDCEVRESMSSPNLRWKDFLVDKNILAKKEKEKTSSPPTVGRALRYSSSNPNSKSHLSTSGSSGNLSGMSSRHGSSAQLSTDQKRNSSSNLLHSSTSTPSLSPSTSFTLTPTKSSSKSKTANEPNVIARGTSSCILLLTWKQPFDEEEPVAVKVITRSNFLTEQQFENAKRDIIKDAECSSTLSRKATKCDSFIRIYGVVAGPITRPVAKLLHVPETEECVGLVMKYESGGSLFQYLHSCNHINISVPERLHILALAARGLAEVHMTGIVHNDIESKNIVLSHHGASEGGGYVPKWTGFGNSIVKTIDTNDIMQSKRRRSRCESNNSEGSFDVKSLLPSLSLPVDSYSVGMSLDSFPPVISSNVEPIYSCYTAPELLDGLIDFDDQEVGLSLSFGNNNSSSFFPEDKRSPNSSSRSAIATWRSDMYSFAIVCWETLTRTLPFDGEEMDDRLAARVLEEGERPPIEDLKDIQNNTHLINAVNKSDGIRGECLTWAVVDTIDKCWHANTQLRKSAMELFVTLNQAYSCSSPAKFDIYISYCVESEKTLCIYVYYWLTKLGYRVWMGINDDRADWDPLYFGSKPPTPTSFPPPPASPPSIGTKSPRETSKMPDKRGSKTSAKPTAITGPNDRNDDQFLGKIANCDVIVAFVNSCYQSQACCMHDLHKAKLAVPPKRIVAIVTEPHPFQWASRELEPLCDLHGHMFVDLSHVASLPEWRLHDPIPTHIVTALKDSLVPLFTILHEIDCFPSNALNNLDSACEENLEKSHDGNKSCVVM